MTQYFLHYFVQQGWPTHVQDELKPYHVRRGELTVEANCLLWGRKVIVPVPEKLQSRVLEELHAAHPGVVRMKSISRIHVWWPEINNKVHGEKLFTLSKALETNHL